MKKLAISCLAVFSTITFSASSFAASEIDNKQEINFMTDNQLTDQTGALITIKHNAINQQFIADVFNISLKQATRKIDEINFSKNQSANGAVMKEILKYVSADMASNIRSYLVDTPKKREVIHMLYNGKW